MSTAINDLFGSQQSTWLVTGAAGFIGSNLCIALVKANQHVVGLDNLATGNQRNLDDIKATCALTQLGTFRFVAADICDLSACEKHTQGVDYVLHQAALGSVPRSIKDPIASHSSNVSGFLNMLRSASTQNVKRFVYASSSSVYGDSPDLPKREKKTGSVLSPYAATKSANELYADVFQRTYGIQCVGLRYFNVFGPRQDPDGEYAAVMPRWIAALLAQRVITINGDGSTSRDFCYIENVVQANIRAALAPLENPSAHVFNIAYGQQTNLNDLLDQLTLAVARSSGVSPKQVNRIVEFKDFRAGDVKHSLASIELAQTLLGYSPTHSLSEGLSATTDWYFKNLDRLQSH